jgi:hypothetical protein
VGNGIAPLSARAATILVMMSANAKLKKVPNRAQATRGGLAEEWKTDDKTKTMTMTEDLKKLKTMTSDNERNKGMYGKV